MSADRIIVVQNSLAWVESLIANCQRRGDAAGVEQHWATAARIAKHIEELREVENV